MDASMFNRRSRRYPAYTDAQLEAFVAEGVTKYRDAAKVADIAAELTARKSGKSVYRPTPQVESGFRPVARIGRM